MSEESTKPASRRAAKGEAQGPQRRELEEAPQLVRKAATILTIGALFPWLTALSTQGHMPWKFWAMGVGLTLFAGFVLMEGAKHRSGLPANGLVKPIVGAHPMAGTGFGLILFVAAIVAVFMGNSLFVGADADMRFVGLIPGDGVPEGANNRFSLWAVMELGTLFLGLATLAHVLAFEYGGKFNPIFPLMFLGPAIAGALNIIGASRQIGGDNGIAILAAIGSLTVAAGGILAMYTMYVSMKQAKVEGDIKRAAERERRKAERESRRNK